MVLNNWQAVWDLLPLSPRSYLLCSEHLARLAHACYVKKVSEYATWSAVVPLTPVAPRGDVNLVYTNYWLVSLPDAEGSP